MSAKTKIKMMVQTQDERDALMQERSQLLSLLRHATQRNHPPSPKSCTPCEQIEKALEGLPY